MDQGLNVLVVDDKVNVRETVKNVLDGLNFSFIDAASGEDALNYIISEKIDLIILDIKLPGINGIETFRQAKKIKPDLPPVIVLTVYNDVEMAVEAGKLGVFDYLLKDPISYDQLRDTAIKATTWRDKTNDNIVKRCFKFGIPGCKYEIPTQKDLVFVGMPFKLKGIYKRGIKPTVVDLMKMKCWHAYEDKRPIDITCKICGSLQAARFAIMDITDLNANVFLEIGLAYGYGKVVILLKDKKTEIPTDLLGFPYFEYSNSNSLKKDLPEHIEAALAIS